MTSAYPILWSWSDPDCEEELCPLCADIYEFKTETLPNLHYKIHKEAVKQANVQAMCLAETDYQTGCSLSWEDLFLHHFAVLYHTTVEELTNIAISDFQEACYAKVYDTDTFCSYHEESRTRHVGITVDP
jgi:hypothetical protein